MGSFMSTITMTVTRLIVSTLCLIGSTLAFPSYYFIPFPSAEELLLRPSGRPFTISVEGSVGAGKSTLLKYFEKYPEIGVYTEPLDIWQNLNGTNFLDLAYNDQKRWGMTFESLVTLTMAEIHMKNTMSEPETYLPIKVMERSIHSARACFIENLVPQMTQGEVAVLDAWYNLFNSSTNMDMEVDLVIYLRTNPEVARDRVMSRNREEELEIPKSFFQRMHQLHEDWLIHGNSSSKVTAPQVLVINADVDISILSTTYENLAALVWNTLPKELKLNKSTEN